MTLSQSDTDSPIVYLVDDDPNDVTVLRRLCESVGMNVCSYTTPQKFLDEFDPEKAGCVIADLLMPEMTGLQLHRVLREAGSQLPLIIVTGHADASTCRAALQEGVFDFVEKSFNPHDLLVVIRRALQKSHEQSRERTLRTSYLAQIRKLSPREREVMRALCDGMSLKEIAAEFQISVQTASKHRSNLFAKLDVHNEVALLKLLYRVDPHHDLLAAPRFPAVTSGQEFLGPGPVPAPGNG